MTIQFNAVFIRNPVKQKSDNWQETSHAWRVSINGADFDYYTGLGHRTPIKMYSMTEEYNRLKHNNLTDDGFKKLLACSKPKPPSLDDILYSLCSDADATEMSFSDLCGNCGYDIDSRKALETFLQCQANAKPMPSQCRKIAPRWLGIEAERKRLEDAGF